MTNDIINKELVNKIESLLKNAREKVVREVNNTLLITYMEIGKAIVEDEKLHIEDIEYENKSLRYLSRNLSSKFGKGFSLANLHFMIAFYKNYGSVQTLSKHLGWSHYCELLSISDKDKRSFYEKECSNARWSVRELRRQIESSLYERLLLSNGKTNKEKVLELALKGNEINTPEDIIKDPYVFEFLGLPENKPLMESDLEESLIKQIEKFILELGKGFMFVGSQQRVTYKNVHYYVDMVFYNKILKSYVLIELKTSQFMPEAVGQLNMYLNYYAAEVNDEYDNPPIGIILCTDKGNVNLEYALGGLNNKIFASKYIAGLPKKEELIKQVVMIIVKETKNDGR
jgi:predicted nuclease of restriction endonuclease-like (RecB) superfamily